VQHLHQYSTLILPNYSCSPCSSAALTLLDSSPTLDHLTIANSGQHGIDVMDGKESITNSIIVHASIALNVDHAAVSIHNSVIADDSFGISNCAGCSIVHAENNYWGTPSGPAPYGNGPGISYHQESYTDPNTEQTYSYDVRDVAVYPWVGEGATLQQHNGPAGNGGSGAGGSSGTAGFGSSGSSTDGGFDAGSAINDTISFGEPVNTATGSYEYSHTDLSLGGRTPLVFARGYNSRTASLAPGPLGYGWTWTYGISLTTAMSGGTPTVQVTFGTGRADVFTGQPDGTYAAAPGQFDALTANSDGSYDVTDKDQTVYHFSSGGALQRITDRNGNVTALSYNGGGQLTAVSAAGGRAFALSDNGDGCIASVTDNSGRGITFGYSSAGDLISVTGPRGHTTGSAYDAVGRTVAVTDALGRAATLGYDAGDDVITRTDALGHSTLTAYDAEGNRLSGASPRGDITTYGYDDANYLTNLASGAHGMVYTYNGDHARVGSAVDGVSTGDVLDLAAGLPTVLQQGTSGVTTTYLYGAGLLGQDDGTDLQTLLPDALGSTRLVVSSGGAVVGHATCDAYGTQTTSGAGSGFGFTDQQTDAASDLVFLRARYYDPTTGVFLGWRGAHVCMGTAAVPAARGHDGAARPRPTAAPDASQLFPWAHRDPAVPHARVVGGLGRGSRSV